MPDPDPSAWLDVLWTEVCARTRRPVNGVRLDRETTGAVATTLFDAFFAEFSGRTPRWDEARQWFTGRAAAHTLAWVAEKRRRSADWQLFRDPLRCGWIENPDFDALRKRSADGAMTSRLWGDAEPVLRRTAMPVLARLNLTEDDAQDVFIEALAELTQPRQDAGPLEKMHVFEELPRFFAVMAERRGQSWLRKVNARKRQQDNPAYADPLDAPDSSAARTLVDPNSALHRDPWSSVRFERLQVACRKALSDFEWRVIEALFVDESHLRQDLAADPWVLGQLGLKADASESTRRRRLNLLVEEALAKLGRELETADW